MNLGPGELLVGRAWRWDREQIATDIDVDRRVKLADGEVDPDPAISVFAVRHDGGEIGDTLDRLRSSVKAVRNAKWLAVVTEGELEAKGFKLELSEPPPDHHDLILGRPAGEATIVSLETVFGTRERVRL
ncbi:hypothetical protein [Microbacterium mangrovi]|uniref:hypothetical protein n=1 Tax=Microbacterium mangrovi TaxID=1348253 RepID=UPI0012E039AC|nr:hypothetical protein [Microbacterium mangrovi]